MRAVVIANAKILIANGEHKNFTESSEYIAKDTLINGDLKQISGLRRGEPFVYKLFLTDKNQLIHLNKTKPIMQTTEVTMGADAKQTDTVINLKKAEGANTNKVIGGIAGAVAGFAFSKYRKVTDKKTIGIHILVGAAIGIAGAYLWDGRKDKVTIKPSK